MILGLQSRYAAVAALKRRGGCGAATFRWCGYDWRGSLYLGLVSAKAKAAYSVHLWYVVSAGPSKTLERAQPSPSTYAKSDVYMRDDFCGWSALGPISLFIEDVIGIKEANAFKRELKCDFAKDIKGRAG